MHGSNHLLHQKCQWEQKKKKLQVYHETNCIESISLPKSIRSFISSRMRSLHLCICLGRKVTQLSMNDCLVLFEHDFDEFLEYACSLSQLGKGLLRPSAYILPLRQSWGSRRRRRNTKAGTCHYCSIFFCGFPASRRECESVPNPKSTESMKIFNMVFI